MLREGRDELTCDLAETYQIFDMRSYPVSLIATLAAGLQETSRINMKMAGQRLTTTDSLLAIIYDKLNWLCWAKTEDAQHKKNRPKSLFMLLTTDEKEDESATGFDSPEEFEKRRREILEENNG